MFIINTIIWHCIRKMFCYILYTQSFTFSIYKQHQIGKFEMYIGEILQNLHCSRKSHELHNRYKWFETLPVRFYIGSDIRNVGNKLGHTSQSCSPYPNKFDIALLTAMDYNNSEKYSTKHSNAIHCFISQQNIWIEMNWNKMKFFT